MGWPRRRRQQQQQLRRRASLESVGLQTSSKHDVVVQAMLLAAERTYNTQVDVIKTRNENPAMESDTFTSKPAMESSKWHHATKTSQHSGHRRHGGLRQKLYSVDSLAETDDEEEDEEDETASEEGSENGDRYAVQLSHEPVSVKTVVHEVETVQEEPVTALSPVSKTLVSDEEPSLCTVEELPEVQVEIEVEINSTKTLDGSTVMDGEDTESEDGDLCDDETSSFTSCAPSAPLMDAEIVHVDLFGQRLNEKETEHAPFLFPPPYFPGDLDEYENDIYETLLRREKLHHVVTDYFSFQPHVTGVMRSMLVDWLVEVHNHFNLQPETLFLTVNYIDRFLAAVPVKRENFQLVALTALLIASKYEEVHPVDIEDLVYICERSYTAQQIVAFEKEMLLAFKWQLVVPTASGFLEFYIDKLSIDLHVAQLATFFSEQSLLDFHLSAKYVPSVVASSALLLAQCYAAKDKPELAWVLEFEEVTGYYAKDIWCCVRELSDMLASLSFDLVAVRTKFRSSRFGRVADVPHVNVSGIVIE